MPKPTKKLTIKLNNDYKSFKAEFETTLEGDLIILSGTNGSGKSQLLDIISRINYRKENVDMKVNASVSLDSGQSEILESEIISKSFVINITSLPLIGVNQRQSLLNTAWIWQTQGFSENYISGYSNCAKGLQKHISNETDFQYTANDEINREKFKKAIPANFVLFPDDTFNRSIYSIFQNYLHIESIILRKKGQDNLPDLVLPKTKPWELLNDLFKKFSFSYQFDEPKYSSENELESQPLLKNTITGNDTSIDTLELSSGEKAIFNLVLASLEFDQDKIKPKILLLDEYDATFNPSLTEVFYQILVEFYISRGTTVILTTHNPITATFAPITNNFETTFYEMYKESENLLRIVKKTAGELNEIGEVKKVLSAFYPQVGALEKQVKELKKANKPALLCEGPSDKTILTNAWNSLKPNTDIPFSIIDAEGCNNISPVTNKWFSKLGLQLIVICDYDHAGIEAIGKIKINGQNNSLIECSNPNYNGRLKKSIDGKIHTMTLPVPSNRNNYISPDINTSCNLTIEHLFEDDKIKHYCKEVTLVGEIKLLKMKDDNGRKTKFADSTKSFSPDDFKNFQPIFEIIEGIIKPKTSTEEKLDDKQTK